MILKGCVRVKTVITYILLGVVALGVLFIFVSSFSCENCERLEEEIEWLEFEIDELKSDIIWDLEEASGDLYGALEYLDPDDDYLSDCYYYVEEAYNIVCSVLDAAYE